STGSVLVYSTYLGGNSDDYGQGIAVDSAGNAYVTGYTHSAYVPGWGGVPFPTTVNAIQDNCSTGAECGNTDYPDAFVAELNANGSALVYSTYLGAYTGATYG